MTTATMTDYRVIQFDVVDRVATITLNRPERLNAISRAVVREVVSALERCRIDDGVRAIVIRGAGRAFCSGDDLKGDDSDPPAGPPDIQTRLKTTYPRIVHELLQIRKPVIARVHGYATGAGFDIALACDVRIAEENTKFGALFVRRGVGGGCTYLLPRYVGVGRATDLLFTGDFIEAPRALEWGLVTRVVPEAQLDATVNEWAERFASGPTGSYALIKTARNQGLGVDPVKGLEYQVMANWELMLLQDAKEGPRAFREKRTPTFTGRWIELP